jgi:hypothetical protein
MRYPSRQEMPRRRPPRVGSDSFQLACAAEVLKSVVEMVRFEMEREARLDQLARRESRLHGLPNPIGRGAHTFIARSPRPPECAVSQNVARRR